jgi:8-oxo-dGTP pyrophosphatase MutT (NUDIX family)
MAPPHRERTDHEKLDPAGVIMGAVLVLIFVNQEEVFFPVIERVAYDGVHGGQVSLPGGKMDADDHSLMETALRECYEEIGINSGIEMVGKLTSLYIPVSRFLVEPYVAICNLSEVVFVPHTREVSHVLKMPLRSLLANDACLYGEVSYGKGFKVTCPYFEVEGRRIWGATAMILNELREVLGATA